MRRERRESAVLGLSVRMGPFVQNMQRKRGNRLARRARDKLIFRDSLLCIPLLLDFLKQSVSSRQNIRASFLITK